MIYLFRVSTPNDYKGDFVKPRIIAALLLALSWLPLFPPAVQAYDFEISAGFSMLIYQTVLSFNSSTALEAAVGGGITPLLDWQAGVRLGLDPMLADEYVRLSAAPEIAAWRPAVGLELGLTNRGRFGAGAKLLRENREAMDEIASPVYLAVHAAPLSFAVWDDWRLSFLEVQFGTHLGEPGKTLRAQIGLVSVGRSAVLE